jgi:hypothetical protein
MPLERRPVFVPFDPNQVTPCGKTYAQIDADKAEYVQGANDVLSSMRNLGSRWWCYIVSHRSFEMVVGDPLGKGNLVLILTGCDSISGPVSWPNQRLTVIWDCDSERLHKVWGHKAWEFVLEDKSVGFRAVAGTFGWQRDYDLVRYGSVSCPRSDPEKASGA